MRPVRMAAPRLSNLSFPRVRMLAVFETARFDMSARKFSMSASVRLLRRVRSTVWMISVTVSCLVS